MKYVILGKSEAGIFATFMVVAIALITFIPQGIESIGAVVTERKLPIYSVETDKKQIAITFDAAWSNSDTDEIISILNKYNAKATFFFTGQWVSKFPNDVLKFHAAGNECANHSDSHPHIDKLSVEEIKADTEKCNDKLKALTGKAPTLYRGPYGEYNNTLLDMLEEMKIFCIQWDIDSRDWQGKTVDEMHSSVTKNVRNGSIILFHNDTKNTPAALDKILSTLSKDGYKFVTVSELIYKKDFRLDSAGRQYKIS